MAVTVSGGAVNGISSFPAAGTGYRVGDIITIDSGNKDATLTITNIDAITGATITAVDTSSFADAGVVLLGSEVFKYTGKTATSFTGCDNQVGTPLTTLNTYSGTDSFSQTRFKLDLVGGSLSGDNARLKDWWLDHEMGIIYFNNSYPFFEWNAVKVSYIYGERYLEKAIEEAATKLVAADLLMSDDRSVLVPEGTQNVDLASKIQLYRKEAQEILNRYREVVVFE